MYKILMVCLGNICRSPVAEGVMRDLIKKNNINALVDSAGTANYHIGKAPDKRSIANAKKFGLDISDLRARQFTANDFDAFDVIYVMDASNYSTVTSMAKNNSQVQKVKFLLDEIYPNEHKPVPDPYYGLEKDFDTVFALVEKACTKITLSLKE